jgi:two-component system NtrC family sensor kinase
VSDPVVVRRAEKIDNAARRCVRIVRNFLALARRRAPERGEVQLNDVAQEAVELLAYELRTGNVEVSLGLAEDLPVLWADGHQLHQVLVNIVANAHHAMRQSRTRRRLSITTERGPGQEVRLAIADTGPGIPAEIRAKIFEPFFTTKPPGEGTGLGLSLCRGIVEEHGGTIGVESEPGRGTTFLIRLPVVPRPTVEAAPDIAEAPLVAVGPKTILIVDDEAEIAAILVEALERDGYHTETSENGVDALRRLEERAYDLVLSDTKMPVMDGIELYREMERRFPKLQRRIIFVTGDVLDTEKQHFIESTGVPILTKPFDLSEVRRVVRRRLVDAAQV